MLLTNEISSAPARDHSLARVGAHCRDRAGAVFCHHVTREGTRHVTFGELGAAASGYADALRRRGVVAGDIVLIFLPHAVDQYASYLGAMALGAVPSFMPCPSKKQHPDRYWSSHRALLDRIRPAALITDAAHARQMREAGLVAGNLPVVETGSVPPGTAPLEIPAAPDAIALLQHSSGTTGLKKGVALSHRAIANQVAAYSGALGIGDGDVIASWLPLYHDMGLMACMIMPLILGVPVVAMDPFHWAEEPRLLFQAIQEYRATHCWLPNFAFEHLRRTIDAREETYDLRSMKAFINCSEPCKIETFEHFQHDFAGYGVTRESLQVCYAMAETVFAVTQTVPGQPIEPLTVDAERLARAGEAVRADPGPGSTRLCPVGLPIAGQEIAIAGENGTLLPPGRVGEVVIRGNSLFSGYFRLEEETRKRLVDGTYFTRDLGFILDGALYILGRKDDLVIISGRNLYAHDVEALVSAIPGVRPGRAVAFGVFNPDTGSEELIVVAEQQDGAALPVLRREIREQVFDATGITPQKVQVVAQGWLVKTTSGKISREGNRQKYLTERRAKT